MNPTKTDQPQTREEFIELLRNLVGQHSRLQFKIGAWAVETLDRFGGTCKDLADEINMGNTTLNEWVNVRRFWLTSDLPPELVERMAALDVGLQSNLLNYSHFRNARRQAVAQTKDRVEGVRIAIDFLEHILDDNVKHSVMDAEVAAITGGEEFVPSVKVWDSRDYKELSATDIGREVANRIRAIRLDGHVARVVVYAEAASG